MANNASLASYEFRRGALAGSHLSLFGSYLEHRSAEGFEMIPLDRVGALNVAYERDTSRISWGGMLLFIAFLVIVAFVPLRMFAATMAGEVSAQAQGTFFPAAVRAFEFCVSLLPLASLGLAAWAAVWIGLGWIGQTVLTVVIAPSERVFATRGRDPLLREFADSVAEQLARRG